MYVTAQQLHRIWQIAENDVKSLSDASDFNGDSVVNIRDAAAIANYLATK
ncbi:MAG: dockerin type I domain-containing protein [Porcipelethomonas sp.]